MCVFVCVCVRCALSHCAPLCVHTRVHAGAHTHARTHTHVPCPVRMLGHVCGRVCVCNRRRRRNCWKRSGERNRFLPSLSFRPLFLRVATALLRASHALCACDNAAGGRRMRVLHIMRAVGRVAASASWRFCTLQPPYCAHIIRCLLPIFLLPTSVLPQLPPPHNPAHHPEVVCKASNGQWGTGAWGRIDWRSSVLQYALAHDAALHIASHTILHAALHPTAMPTLIDADEVCCRAPGMRTFDYLCTPTEFPPTFTES